MAGVRNIVGMGNDPAQAAPDSDAGGVQIIRTSAEMPLDLSTDDAINEIVEESQEPAATGSKWTVLFQIFCFVAALAWTGFFLWAQRGAIAAGVTPMQASEWIVQWAVPMILLATLHMLVMRNSTREAEKFGAITRSLSQESALLEARIQTINSELSLAREFIANQSHELESIGRTATKRLTGQAEKIREAIADSDTRMQTIGEVSESAAANLEKIRGQLPVVANSAKDVTNQIGNAGRTAQTHIESMVQGFRRINEFGQASEVQVNKLQARTETALAAMQSGFDGLVSDLGGQIDKLTSETMTLRENLVAEAQMAVIAMQTQSSAAVDGLATAVQNMTGDLTTRLATVATQTENLRTQLSSDSADAFDELQQRGQEKISALVADIRTAANAMTDNLGVMSGKGELLRNQLEQDYAALVNDISSQTAKLLAELDEASIALSAKTEAQLAHIDSRHSDLAAKLSGQQQSLTQQVDTALTRLAAMGNDTDAALTSSLNAYDAAMTQMALRRTQEGNALSQLVGSLNNLIDDISHRIATLDSEGGAHTAKLAFALTALNDNINRLTQSLASTQESTTRLMENSKSVSLSVEHSATRLAADLPTAMDALEVRLQQGTRSLAETRAMTDALQGRYAAFEEAVSATTAVLQQHMAIIDTMQETSGSGLLAQQDILLALVDKLKLARHETDALSEATQTRLASAIGQIRTEIAEASEHAGRAISGSIDGAAQLLGTKTEATLDRVMQGKAAEIVAKLDGAVTHAIDAANQASIHLRDQLLKVDELAGNLEQRVARARESAEEQTDNAFARRVALITESLNSTAIDVAKILSNDITDTAWAAYLKGDRGVFTRRAVRLLDAGEAKEILAHYENDVEFQGHVNRYIHDFESMLRNLLSTRDGGAVGVTLLSSDIGKLYVALAQAIERLRT